MNPQKTNVNLLLGKIRAYLDSIPAEKRKGKKYVEAVKAMNRLVKMLSGEEDSISFRFCRSTIPAM